MKRNLRIIILVLAGALLCAPAPARNKVPKEVKMSKEVLKDKIYGAWAGKVIGCTYGGPTEFRFATTINRNIDIIWDDDRVKWYYDHAPGLYDDVYMDLTFVEVFEKEGLDAPIESFAKAFAYAEYPLWHANLQARYNIQHGIMPPNSGNWEYNAHADDIDFQIEADYAGIMAPGMVNTATFYTDGIGHIMNYGDGWYGGAYVAAMLSLAFVSDDIDFVVTEALKVIPEQTRYHRAMADVIRWHKQYPEDWNLCWALVNRDYGFSRGCPSSIFGSFNIDAVLNSAYILIGLLYGNKDFYRTIDISTRCGADSDCNPSSAAGILGAMMGYSNIPEYWRRPLDPVLDRDFAYTDISLLDATQMSYNQALKVIANNGGSVEGDYVKIVTQKPLPLRYEEAFEGHWPVENRPIRKNLANAGELSFDGKGIVVTYNFVKVKDYVEHGYEAEVEVYLDGKLSTVAKLPAGGNGQTREIYVKYNLPLGPHKVSFNWLNKEKDIDITLSSAVVYSDQLKLSDHENH